MVHHHTEHRRCERAAPRQLLRDRNLWTRSHYVKYYTILWPMDLKLSKRGDYVVRSAICLARAYPSGQPTKLRQVSADMGVPRTYVSQILGDLVRGSVAVSSFGVHGGYRLARPPASVTLLQVVEAGEGPLEADGCALGDGPVRWSEVCPLHEAWGKASRALRASLAATSLAELTAVDQAIEAGIYVSPPDAHRQRPAAVGVSDSVQVELAADTVAAQLRRGGSWLAPHVTAATAEGEAVQLRVGPAGPAWLGKTVSVRLGRPDSAGGTLQMAIAWEATGPSGLFPRFEGTLQLAELDPERCELSLTGHYRPPLGRTGQVLDEAFLARVARATVRSLLRRVAHGLEQAAESPLERSPRPGGEIAGAIG